VDVWGLVLSSFFSEGAGGREKFGLRVRDVPASTRTINSMPLSFQVLVVMLSAQHLVTESCWFLRWGLGIPQMSEDCTARFGSPS